MKTIKLTDITITDDFARSSPSPVKLKLCRDNYIHKKIQDRYIVINKQHELIDGYILYLVLKEAGVKRVKVKFDEPSAWQRLFRGNNKSLSTYVIGTYLNSGKKSGWKLPKSMKPELIKKGDFVMVKTKNGVTEVEVNLIGQLPSSYNFPQILGKCL